MQSNGTASRMNVARYDDDYPLLYGEPALQPQWDTTAKVVPLPQNEEPRKAALACATACRSCGRCRR